MDHNSTEPTPPQTSIEDELTARLARLSRPREKNAPPDRRARRPRRPARRHHAARTARLGALAASVVATGGLAAFFAVSGSGAALGIGALPQPMTPTVMPSATAAPVPDSAASPAASAVVAIDGERVVTEFGPVHVQGQFSNGVLRDVAVLAYPKEDGESVEINGRALPRLRESALATRSAPVDTISGATYTSDAYRRSLQAAIDEARAAGVVAV